MKNIHTLLLSVLSVFVVMLVFETVKEYLFAGSLTAWQSHWITIIFTTLVSFIVTLSVINRLNTLREKYLIIKLKEEKLKSIKQVLNVAQHYVNNLSNNLSIVQIELNKTGVLSEKTITELNKAIKTSSEELNKIGEMDDPYDENSFKITF